MDWDKILQELQPNKSDYFDLSSRMVNWDDGISLPRHRMLSKWTIGTEQDIENRILKILIQEMQRLIADMWFWGYEGHMDSQPEEWQMWHIANVLERMSDFGIYIEEE